MSISAIVPVWNGRELLERLLVQLAGARGANAHARAGAVAPEKEELCLCGDRGVARS